MGPGRDRVHQQRADEAARRRWLRDDPRRRGGPIRDGHLQGRGTRRAHRARRRRSHRSPGRGRGRTLLRSGAPGRARGRDRGPERTGEPDGVYTTDEAVVIEVDPGSAASKSARTFESRLESELAAVGARVPVEIVPSPQKVPASRFGHGGPWVGGALYQTNDSGGACSTGFAGTSTVNSSLQGIITAHHCTVDQPASYTYKHFTRDLGKRIYHHTPGHLSTRGSTPSLTRPSSKRPTARSVLSTSVV